MKTKTTAGRVALPAALLALSLGVTAQPVNSSYNANTLGIAGSQNATFGSNSLLMNTASAQENTSIGWSSMLNNKNGSTNTSGGYSTLFQNVNGNSNTAFGAKALDQTTSNNNSGFGLKALTTNQTGNDNSALGIYADVSATNFNNATALGANAVVNASDRVWVGDANVDVWTTNIFTTSDGRFKKNITTGQVKGLEFIRLLRPVTYNFDGKGFTEYVTKNMDADSRKHYAELDFTKSDKILQTGFIAQEVEQAAKTAGYNFSGVHVANGETDTYGISYYQFVVPLVKAVQEQQQMIEEQKVLIGELQLQNADQQKAIAALQAKTSGATGLNQPQGINGYNMEQNEPNPFSNQTLVKYSLPESVNTAYMAIYDLSGKQLSTLPLTQKGSGSIAITSEKLAAGIYIYSIVADGKVFDSKRMVVAEK